MKRTAHDPRLLVAERNRSPHSDASLDLGHLTQDGAEETTLAASDAADNGKELALLLSNAHQRQFPSFTGRAKIHTLRLILISTSVASAWADDHAKSPCTTLTSSSPALSSRRGISTLTAPA